MAKIGIYIFLFFAQDLHFKEGEGKSQGSLISEHLLAPKLQFRYVMIKTGFGLLAGT